MKRTPSLFRIVQVDYLASIGVLLPIAVWGLTLISRFLDPEATPFLTMLAAPLTLVGLILITWRAWTVRSVLGGGTEVRGIVSSTGFFRGRGRIQYLYTYQGKKYEGSNSVQANRITRSLAQGQEVTVLVDNFKPKRAFLRELYL